MSRIAIFALVAIFACSSDAASMKDMSMAAPKSYANLADALQVRSCGNDRWVTIMDTCTTTDRTCIPVRIAYRCSSMISIRLICAG